MKCVKTVKVAVKDLNKYNLHPCNRSVDKPHVNEIKRDILKYGIETFVHALIVSILTNILIDGQHRAQALYELYCEGKISGDLKVKVELYEMTPEEELREIRKLQKAKQWGLGDNIMSLISEGNENVIAMHKWGLEHELTQSNKGKTKIKLRATYAFLKPSVDNNAMREGSFTITDEDIKDADRTHYEIKNILDALDIPSISDKSYMLITAWKKRRDKHSHSFAEWKSILKRYKATIKKDYSMSCQSGWENIFSHFGDKLEDEKKIKAAKTKATKK